MSAQHIVNISGGKDSQACALLANYRALDKSTRDAVSNILDAAAKAQEAQPTEVAA